MFDRIRAFISFYYVRYLLATELYLLESWERHTTHAILAILFLGLLYINSMVVSGIASYVNHLWLSPPFPSVSAI